jgi:hypothetical protein
VYGETLNFLRVGGTGKVTALDISSHAAMPARPSVQGKLWGDKVCGGGEGGWSEGAGESKAKLEYAVMGKEFNIWAEFCVWLTAL